MSKEIKCRCKELDLVAKRVKLTFRMRLKISITVAKCCADVPEDAAMLST